MKKKTDNVFYIIAAVGLIVMGIVTTTLINSVKNKESSATDIRAKAGVTNTLKLTGTVSFVDSDNRTLTVENVQFAADSRSGNPVNYGTWSVNAPQTFDIFSAAPGNTITFTLLSDSFDVASHQTIASEITVNR